MAGPWQALPRLLSPQVPRPSGVRRGWQRVFAALSDSRLLFFDAPDPRLSPASGALLQALDLRWVPGGSLGQGSSVGQGGSRGRATSDRLHEPPRDPQFSATPVLASDVIHAQSKDLPRIFGVSSGWGGGVMDQTSVCLCVVPTAATFLHLHGCPLPPAPLASTWTATVSSALVRVATLHPAVQFSVYEAGCVLPRLGPFCGSPSPSGCS